MSVLEEATEALRRRQAAADAALQLNRDRATGTGGRLIAAEDYVNATAELADQWLKLAAIERGINPYVAEVDKGLLDADSI